MAICISQNLARLQALNPAPRRTSWRVVSR
jgi:hypothetical protein